MPRSPIQRKAELALKRAVRGVVKRHLESGRSLAVLRDGKVVQLSPKAAGRILGLSH